MKTRTNANKLTAFLLVAALLAMGFSGCGGAGGDAALVEAAPIAQEPVKAQVINVLDYSGSATVVSGGVELPPYIGMRLSAGDKLLTRSNSNVTLDLNNGGIAVLEYDSELEITQAGDDYIEVTLLSGSIINSVEKGLGRYAVRANNVTMGVLGTVFRVDLRGGEAKIDLYEGRVRLTITQYDGEEYSFDLGEGLSFVGSDEAIENSIESGELETTELDLTELPDEALDLITRMLEERESSADDPELLDELLDSLYDEIERRRPDETSPAPLPPAQPVPLAPVTPEPTPDPPPTPPPAPTTPKLTASKPNISAVARSEGVLSGSITLSWTANVSGYSFGYYWADDAGGSLNPVGGETIEVDGVIYHLTGGSASVAVGAADVIAALNLCEVDDVRLITALIDRGGDTPSIKATGAATVRRPTITMTSGGEEPITYTYAMSPRPTVANVCYEDPAGSISLDSTNNYTCSSEYTTEVFNPTAATPTAESGASQSESAVTLYGTVQVRMAFDP